MNEEEDDIVMNDEDNIAGCFLCGLPEGAPPKNRLIRLGFEERLDPDNMSMRLIVARTLAANDAIICTSCIKDIKSMPLSTINDNPPWCTRTSDINIPF